MLYTFRHENFSVCCNRRASLRKQGQAAICAGRFGWRNAWDL